MLIRACVTADAHPTFRPVDRPWLQTVVARAGLEVLVVEANPAPGGNTQTEELTLPGCAHDSCSSAHALIQANPLIHTRFTHRVVRSFLLWMAMATIQDPRRPGTRFLPSSLATGRLDFGWTTPVDVAGHNPLNVGGSCHGGEFLLDGEVLPGWPRYDTGIAGLFLTGSTAHPGGSVSGLPGRNAARAVLPGLGLDPMQVMGPG